jgi:2-haloacid dehalogenase
MPRVIVFDLMGTLLDLQTTQLAMAAVLTDAYEDFGVQVDTALEITSRRYKVSLLGEEKNLILSTQLKLRPYPEVAQSLRRLREAGFTLATLTNSTLPSVEAQLSFAGLRDHFGQLISADEAHCFKPAPEVYQLAASRMGVDPGQMRVVTTHDWDVTGALRAGCAAAFVGRPGQVMNPFGPQPDVRGADLGEVAEKILAAEPVQRSEQSA